MQQLFDTIPKVFRELDKSGSVTEAFVLAAWSRIVGPQLADRSRAVRLDKKRLHVAVAGDAWAKQLESLSPLLLAKFNKKLGDGSVKFIEFRVDADSFEPMRELPSQGSDLSVGSSLADAANRIANEHLRQEFLISAASYIARQQ